MGPPQVWKAACGLRHSAAIAADGSLFTWGEGKHGQVLIAGEGEKRVGIFPPTASNGTLVESGEKPVRAAFVDVACGAKHTVAIDVEEDVWTFGDSRHGSLGRDTQVKEPSKKGESWAGFAGLLMM